MTQTSDGRIRDSIGRTRSNERSHPGEITIHSLQLGEPLVGGADLGDGSVLPQQSAVDPQAPREHVARTAVREWPTRKRSGMAADLVYTLLATRPEPCVTGGERLVDHEGIRPGREGDRKPKSCPCRTNRPASESSRLTDAGEVDDLVEPLGASFGLRPRASPPNQDAPFSGERLDQRGVDCGWLNREPRSTSATCRGLHRRGIDEPFVSCMAL